MLKGAPEQQSDYLFESVLLESDRLNKPLEVKNQLSDLEIFESIDKPYLTGTAVILDDADIMQRVDILGGEKITVKLKSSRSGSVTIVKTFYIDKLISKKRVNDNSQLLVINIIEDIGYTACLININKSYKGRCSEIIKKVSQNFLGKTVDISNTDKQFFKMIVPNLDPLETIQWVSNRASTKEGYPFYMFSVLAEENLKFTDLGTMIENEVINPDISYKRSSLVAKATNRDVRRRTIKNYKFHNSEDLMTLIYAGLIGAQYQYIDTTKNKKNEFSFDIVRDLLKPISTKGVLKRDQNQYMFSEDYKHNGISFNKYKSRLISQIGGSSAYTGPDEILSFSESNITSDYKLNIICRAMDGILKKAPLTIVVPGVDFIDGDKHSTIGNNLRIEFPSSTPESRENKGIDTKASGDYLVFAARHMVKRETYDISLQCVKMANYDT